MPAKVYEAEVAIGANTSQLWSKVSGIGPQLTARLGSMGAAAGAAFSSAFTVGATAGLAALAGGGLLAGWSTKLASDAEEAGSKFGFVFGNTAAATGGQLDAFAAAAGRSRFELRSLSADIGAILGPMGLGAEKTSEMSVGLTKLATDLASFFNATDADALNALRAGIIGESEPLRRFGVTLNEAKIQAEAFRLGIAKTKDEITPAVKAQAIFALVMKETAAAQGDAVRTSGSFANTMRSLQGSIHDAGVEIGHLFLPAAVEIAKFMRGGVGLLDTFKADFEGWGRSIGEITQNVLGHISKLSSSIGEFFGGKVSELIASATGGSVDSFAGMTSKVLDYLQFLTEDFGRLWQLLSTGATLASTTIAKALIDGLQLARGALMQGFSMLPTFMQDAAGGAIDGINAVANAMRDAFANIASGFDALLDHVIGRLSPLAGKFGGVGAAFFGAAGAIAGGQPGAKAVSGSDKVLGAMGALDSKGRIDIRQMFTGMGAGLDALQTNMNEAQRKALEDFLKLFDEMNSFETGHGSLDTGAAVATAGPDASLPAGKPAPAEVEAAAKEIQARPIEFHGLADFGKKLQIELSKSKEKAEAKAAADKAAKAQAELVKVAKEGVGATKEVVVAISKPSVAKFGA